ncbi:MAG: competence protein CoiA family protein [Parachlamydiaceae bacterium]
MQLCALDLDQQLVFAGKAAKQHDYACVECRQTVRLRHGMHRQPHFYHVKPNGHCHLHAKGMPHLMLQYFLKNTLPDGEVEMECRFPAIGRIADVVWHTKHLVYEIQCSPISPEEVTARNADYGSLGYQVVWIFHQDRYNHHRLSAAEHILCDSTHYFTDMNALGEGQVYDQLSIVERGVRIHRLSPLPVDLTSPFFLKEDKNKENFDGFLPKALRQRAKAWTVCFAGDTLDCCLRGSSDELLRQLESLPGGGNPLLWPYAKDQGQNFFAKWILDPYRALFRMFLEKACR